ncbi:hypothetical protein CCACVL1_19529 [Corchorus capsularis]|uniref:Uncharacterized protein n=1 Tax=Corchorus capsularis TaxID=210143 RepID=A0A1R3HGF4_COCAP|nr:hypothetical protein CCACVL1_19529 [Corchorus capsularis]
MSIVDVSILTHISSSRLPGVLQVSKRETAYTTRGCSCKTWYDESCRIYFVTLHGLMA